MRLKAITLSLLSLLIVGTAASIGYASWQYSGDSETVNQFNVNIKEFTFSWTDSDVLDDETYEYASEFPDALNGLEDEDSVEGQALAAAIDAKRSGTDWVGNIDKRDGVAENLNKVLNVSDDCIYIIKIKSDGSFELYVTYETLPSGNSLKRKIGQSFGPVYKTVYQKDSNGIYKATQSYKGTATYTYYDNAGRQTQASFNTDDFKAYSN